MIQVSVKGYFKKTKYYLYCKIDC